FEEEENQKVNVTKPKPQQEIEQESTKETEEILPITEKKKKSKKKPKEQIKSRGKKQKEGDIITIDSRDIRDIMELMENPFLALSKNRTNPITYESSDGKSKVRVSCHPPYYLASIYDWDIILFVASKMQEIINSGEDIPPRTLIVPRHELLKSIHRHHVKKQKEDLESS